MSDARPNEKPTRSARAAAHAPALLLVSFLIALSGAFIGCQEPSVDRSGARFEPAALANPGTGPVIEARWPYWATRMRLHPLTLIAVDRESGDPIVEARVEMLDQHGDSTKCVAQFRFELHASAPEGASFTPLRLWEIDLREAEANRLHYDRVTHTYLFRLSLRDLPELGDDPHLRVFVLSVNGRQFTDVIQVR